MAEVQCPSPFSATGSLAASFQMEVVCPDYNPHPTVVTWNPADKHASIDLSEGNLRADNLDNLQAGVRATASKSAGRWYWEVKVNAIGSGVSIGIGASDSPLDQVWGFSDGGGDAYGYRGHYKVHDGYTVYGDGDSYTTNDIIGIALDLDNGKIWFADNNVWQASGDPVAGTNEAFSGISGTYFPGVSMQGDFDASVTARFNVEDQIYAPPAGFNAIEASPSPFIAEASLSVSEIYAGYVGLDEAFSATASLSNIILQQETPACIFSSTTSGQANTKIELSAGAFSATAGFLCDHCFNYAQIDVEVPTPTCEMAAVFRYARLQAEPPIPTASFIIGKRIQGDSPVPDFTCIAYSGRNPSLIANVPCPNCSMRIGLSLSDVATISQKAGIPIPTCTLVTDTHHLAAIYGQIPCPLITCDADTENIAALLGLVPCPRGLFYTTIGNVANIWGRMPCPSCSIIALNGQIVTLAGSVPVPGDLVRFYASLKNEGITLAGTVPTPDMISSVRCLVSSILRHVRGTIR